MEKFQKYCLSVLLVIISSNISAQVSNGTIKSEDCTQLYEMYSQYLNSKACNALEKKVLNINAKRRLSINDKKNAADILGYKNQHVLYPEFENRFSTQEKHHQVLINFFNKNKYFAEVLDLEIKVSKIRNKDYLDVIG
ncbi:hypothetical protein ASG31_02180 [Chryseobacterium sp. Leaf404]|uniref:hypothetical protein n=1 Tax=unclassified Chryseobacterium TaxID=2593645 RepID=UPI000700AACB|nr:MULTISPECIES: hypothetical protein [unclassified Chryseobacterium]KQT22172.1 hypothetical protein ASG31_02180 [Chryseobacterium sp. Leaf404]